MSRNITFTIICFIILLIFSDPRSIWATPPQTFNDQASAWMKDWKRTYPSVPQGGEGPVFNQTLKTKYTSFTNYGTQPPELFTLGPLQGSEGKPFIEKKVSLQPRLQKITLSFTFVHQGMWNGQMMWGHSSQQHSNQFIVFLNDKEVIRNSYTYFEQYNTVQTNKYDTLVSRGNPERGGYQLGVYQFAIPFKVDPQTGEMTLLSPNGEETNIKISALKKEGEKNQQNEVKIGFGSTLPNTGNAHYEIGNFMIKEDQVPLSTSSDHGSSGDKGNSKIPPITITIVPIPLGPSSSEQPPLKIEAESVKNPPSLTFPSQPSEKKEQLPRERQQ